jgi:hypothetical protein
MGNCQTYSSMISDSTIINFILLDLKSNYMFPNPDSSEKTIKIFHKLYPWSELELQTPDSVKNTEVKPFEDKNLFIDLKRLKNIEVSKEDQQYMHDQMKAINYQHEWSFPKNDIKIQNNSRNLAKKTTYYISVPIFSKDKSIVFIKRYVYCGPLCAEHAVFIYQKLKGSGYKIIHFTNYWVS